MWLLGVLLFGFFFFFFCLNGIIFCNSCFISREQQYSLLRDPMCKLFRIQRLNPEFSLQMGVWKRKVKHHGCCLAGF